MLLKIATLVALLLTTVRFLYPALMSIVWQFYIVPVVLLILVFFLVTYLYQESYKKLATVSLIMFLQYWPVSLLFHYGDNLHGIPFFCTFVMSLFSFFYLDFKNNNSTLILIGLTLTYLNFSFMIADNIHARYVYEKPWPYEALTPTGDSAINYNLAD